MKSEKTEGSPCKKCGSTVRYVNISNRAKEGKCVQCVSDRSETERKKKFARKTLSVGIKEPYRMCYEQGHGANKNTQNPYPISEIGKRCAWYAGFNDHHHKEIK